MSLTQGVRILRRHQPGLGPTRTREFPLNRHSGHVVHAVCSDIVGNMRLVLDTCVIVSGLRSNLGASRLFLTGALERRFTVLVSVPLFLEYEAVLSRSDQRAELGWTISDTAVFLDAFASVAEPVRMSFLWRPLLKDPGDEMVLETAVNGNAELLVTHNVKHFATVPPTFGVQIQTPRNALARLRRNEKKAE